MTPKGVNYTMKWALFLVLLCTVALLGSKPASGSYLDVPRIHFSGQYRADVNTRNNWPCNFDPNNPIYEPQEWNYNGTADWEFVDTVVTAVVDENGNEVQNSPLLGARVFSNEDRPFAKIVDIDVDFQVSTVYGLHFGLRKGTEKMFQGDWSTSVLVHDMWYKMKCAIPNHHDAIFGAQSTTKITNIEWSSAESSQKLRAATMCPDCTGDLTVSITISMYSNVNFTIGEVNGTIGVSKTGEPMNVGGQRKLETADPGTLQFPPGHICLKHDQEEQKPWTYGAPFQLDESRSTLVVDLGNALPVQNENIPIDFGPLWFGAFDDESVQIFGNPIPYLDESMWNQGGIFEQTVDSDTLNLLKTSKLVVVVESNATAPGSHVYPIRGAFPSLGSEVVQLLLSETAYFIRPTDYYMDRLEYSDSTGSNVKDTSDMTLLVTYFGEPVGDAEVTVQGTYNQQGQTVLPLGGVLAAETTKTTNSSGLVTFTFQVSRPIPLKRRYIGNPCLETENEADKHGMEPHRRKFALKRGVKREVQKAKQTVMDVQHVLPIDGQLYNFFYCLGTECTVPDDGGLFLYKAVLSFLAFSTVNYTTPYTWEDHVQPIFEQFYHLHYIMRTILDLNNFTEVTQFHNIQLLKLSLSLDFLDPNYMPVTRDLSPTKQAMILGWLDNPRYSSTSDNDPHLRPLPVCQSPPSPTYAKVPSLSHFHPPRCLLKNIPFDVDPEKEDAYFHSIFLDERHPTLREAAMDPPRPLFAYGSDQEDSEMGRALPIEPFVPVCNIDNVRDQLQKAVQLEFYTLPLYLTALYSIMEHCNVEAYHLIRNITMQEMLHFTQAANTLIGIGGTVRIDDPEFVPSYPATGLPGGVLPNLTVSLKKFDLLHVYNNFMAIETPALTFVGRPEPEYTLNTIGQLYKEIKLCLKILGEDIYPPGTEEKQVQWPWQVPADTNVGSVYIVTSFESAKAGIDQIVEQGEGANPFNPNDSITGQYAHFYRFEEIVCQKRLILTENGYAYDGLPIPYNPAGVWPMRDSPSKDDIIPGTKCRTEAKAFHRVYRNFLRVLDATFNGAPEKISEAVELMEALQVHAKKTMWTPYNKVSTCGPVWDYEWD